MTHVVQYPWSHRPHASIYLPKLAGRYSRKASFKKSWVRFRSCVKPSGSLGVRERKKERERKRKKESKQGREKERFTKEG